MTAAGGREMVGRRHRRLVGVVRALASTGLAVGLVTVVVPRMTGDHWSQIASALEAVTLTQLGVLVILWALGLVAHSTTLAAAMPALGRRRALMLSLTGSAVANVVPFGGAAGVALNYRMTRTWGFDRATFGIYTVVTNLWDVLARLSLPAVALAGLAVTGYVGVGHFVGTATLATGLLLVVLASSVVLLANGGVTERVGQWLDRLTALVLGVTGREHEARPGRALVRLRADTNQLVRTAWPRLTFGVAIYATLLACLLWACLHITGAGVGVPVVLAALALDRVATMVPLTPGGAGVVEVGLTGLLVAFGGDPVASVTGALLYRAFTYGLEIPIGGAGIMAWLWANRSDHRSSTGPALARSN